jgi:uncharacterized protein involved in outer membrane biogenesis
LSGRKALLAALASLLTLSALAALALVVHIDAPGLAQKIEDQARSATGIPLEVSRARLRLLGGLVLEEVIASASFVAGSYRVHVPRVVLEHRPLGLLRGRLEVTGVRLERPTVQVDLPRQAGTTARIRNAALLQAVEASEPWLEVEASLETVRIEGGNLLVGDRVSVEGLGMTLTTLVYDRRALTPLHALRSEGSFAIGEMALESSKLTDVAGSITTENGRFRLENLRLTTDRGALSGALALDFNSFPFRYRATLLGRSFEVEGLGRGTLRFEAEGFGTRSRNLTGRGNFALERGRLPDNPWVREIDPALAGAEHAPVEIAFEVRNERVHFERLELDARDKIVAIEGSVGLDGGRDIRATVNRRPD